MEIPLERLPGLFTGSQIHLHSSYLSFPPHSTRVIDFMMTSFPSLKGQHHPLNQSWPIMLAEVKICFCFINFPDIGSLVLIVHN